MFGILECGILEFIWMWFLWAAGTKSYIFHRPSVHRT